jgi:hypothetical protein
VFCIVARYLSEKRLTQQAWTCLLRLGHYLVATIELPLILRRSPTGAEMLAFVDSAKGNVDGGRSQARRFLLLLPRERRPLLVKLGAVAVGQLVQRPGATPSHALLQGRHGPPYLSPRASDAPDEAYGNRH